MAQRYSMVDPPRQPAQPAMKPHSPLMRKQRSSPGQHHCDYTCPVLKRGTGIAGIILEPEITHTKIAAQPFNRIERSSTYCQRWHSHMTIGNRKQRTITPGRLFMIFRQLGTSDMWGYLLVIVMDCEDT